MRKTKIAGAFAALALGGAVLTTGLAGAAQATPASDCTPQPAVNAVVEVSHTDFQYKDWVPTSLFTGHWDYRWSHKDVGLISIYDWKTWARTGVTQKHIEVAGVTGHAATTCVAGEPRPKVLPIPGVNNDQIYENPSEQFVEHITGEVSQGWNNGVAKITYYTDAGWLFADGSHVKTVTVNEIQGDIVIPLPDNPFTGTDCVRPSTVFATPAATGHFTWGPVANHIALNGKVGVVVTADDGYVFSYGGNLIKSKNLTATRKSCLTVWAGLGSGHRYDGSFDATTGNFTATGTTNGATGSYAETVTGNFNKATGALTLTSVYGMDSNGVVDDSTGVNNSAYSFTITGTVVNNWVTGSYKVTKTPVGGSPVTSDAIPFDGQRLWFDQFAPA